MLRKFLLSASLALAGLIFLGLSASTLPALTAPQSGQQPQQSVKSVAGTVSSIGNGGHSFALDVSDGGAKQTLQFVVDKDTQVQGEVKVGTAVMVQSTLDAVNPDIKLHCVPNCTDMVREPVHSGDSTRSRFKESRITSPLKIGDNYVGIRTDWYLGGYRLNHLDRKEPVSVSRSQGLER